MNGPVMNWALAVADYLALRRAMGYQLRMAGRLLADFAGYLARSGASAVTIQAATQWAMQPADASPAWWAARLSVVRGFAVYLASLDPATQIPPAGLLPHRTHRPIPHLYSRADVVDLMTAAGRLTPALRAATYSTLIGLLAVTGLRVGEAIRLGRDDVDLRPDTGDGLLTVRRSKFNSSRQLPLHDSTVTALTAYARVRDQLCPTPRTDTFFVSTRGTTLIYNNVRATFRSLAAAPGQVGHDGPHRRPARVRINDLRHSFAVTTLLDWHADGVDVDSRLPLLSAYLGHGDPAFLRLLVKTIESGATAQAARCAPPERLCGCTDHPVSKNSIRPHTVPQRPEPLPVPSAGRAYS
jgi:integrase